MRRNLLSVLIVSLLLPGLNNKQCYADNSLPYDLFIAAAGEALGDFSEDSVLGWMFGSAGSADRDLAVLKQILGELQNIEATLEDIDRELEELNEILNQLDCDTWVQQALPMVDAISNLWNPFSQKPHGEIQQSYMGILAETKRNEIGVDEIKQFVDRVLNTDGAGINGLSVIDYLQDLARVLIPPAGGSGLIESCLAVPSNGPSKFKGQKDAVYYNATVAPLTDYYYRIQLQGLIMVVESHHFQAWLASGSPISDVSNIKNLGKTICGSPSNSEVRELCDNANWVVVGTDGQSGVRDRIAQQLIIGGAPYTQDWKTSPSSTMHEGVVRFTGFTELWPSSPVQFSNQNSNDDCVGLDSNSPCGILSGVFDAHPNLHASYGMYGGYGLDGTWMAASGIQLLNLINAGPDFTTEYKDVRDWLIRGYGFSDDLPENIIFLTSQVTACYPYDGQDVNTNVITFTDTGLTPDQFPPMFGPPDITSFISYSNSLQTRCKSESCEEWFTTNRALPAAENNAGFYVAFCTFWCCDDGDICGEWESSPPGWSTDLGAAAKHPQFRLPVINVTKLDCSSSLSSVNPGGAYTMCGTDFQMWLDTQVPPAPKQPPTNGITDPNTNHEEEGLLQGLLQGTTVRDCEKRHPPSNLNPGGPKLPYDRFEIWEGEGAPFKCSEMDFGETNDDVSGPKTFPQSRTTKMTLGISDRSLRASGQSGFVSTADH